MLQLEGVGKAFGGQQVLEGVSLHIAPGERMALVGANGSGKTTLMRIIIADEEADAGSVILSHGTTVSYLPQEIENLSGGTLLEEMVLVFSDIHELEDRLRALEEEMEHVCADETGFRALAEQYSVLRDRYEHSDPETQRARIFKVLSGLGFSESDYEKSVELFSGGWQMRIALARILLRYPSLLLLDEPTNHLDIPSLEWLEEFLGEHRGSLVVVSHDRYFLDRLCTQVAELEGGRLTLYHGNYTSYVRQKEERLELHEKRWDEQQRFLKRNQEFMDRFRYKATKAKAVKSREKMLDKMDLVEAPLMHRKKIRFSFRMERHTREEVLTLKNLVKCYPGKTIGFDGEVQLARGDRVALVGPNGVGKSTLLKMIAGIERPDGGKLLIDTEADVGYYSQLQSEALDHARSPVEELEESVAFSVTREEIRRRLGCFLLSGDAALKPIEQLSGGEKARVALARLTLQPVNLMLLDEPTNHLDITSRDVLAEALGEYEGTVILISHDRYFLDQTVNKVLALDGETLRLSLGNYTEYVERRRREARLALLPAPRAAKKAAKAKAPPREKGPDVKKMVASLEDSIAVKEEELRTLEEELAALCGDPGRQLEAVRRYQAVKDELTALAEKWEEWMTRLEDERAAVDRTP